ncbi:transferase [Lithospermum erythrorhizon]|uniref:Sulfotransferase n=1 Tax=Lithospermum erythrorhizon TaxID=34254 RepID=A0AAV3NVR0_LITER
MVEQESSNTPNEDFLNQLKRTKFWDAMDICNWEGFWFEPGLVKSALTFQKTFEAQSDDVVLASTIKTGTTWLKALCLCILEKNSDTNNNVDILEKECPQFQVPTIESLMYVTKPSPDVYSQPSPRLFHTHLPFSVLPESIKKSNCKIVYIARNPKDTLVSLWHFFNTIFRPDQEPYPLEKAVENFCNGVQQYGPFYEHVLQYYLESRKRPEKILFLKYEDLQRDPRGEVKKLASFLGKNMGEKEVDKVLWRCSLERLKNLEVNKNGSVLHAVPNSSYFRLGVVGDWKNYLTPEMEDRINETTSLKLDGFGLHFDASN